MTKVQGKEYAETGITINALAPAVIQTAMVEALPAETVKYMTDKIPMKRCGSLEEAASIAAFIVSPECSFTTGFTFLPFGWQSDLLTWNSLPVVITYLLLIIFRTSATSFSLTGPDLLPKLLLT